MSDHDRARWGRALTTAGWLFVVAYLTFLTSQIRRAVALQRPSFEDGLWGQRIELISFATLPQNLIILVPAAAAGAVGTVLVGDLIDRTDMWLAQLVRVVAGLSYVIVVIAVLGIIAVFWRSPDGLSDVVAILGRFGGILIAIAIARVSLEAERS